MNIIKNNIIYIYTGLIAIISMLFISSTTSPLYNVLGEHDSSIFLYIGKMISQGESLYVDIFDHKGPILFFLNAFPQLIFNSPLSVWILQTIMMGISLYLIMEIGRMLTGKYNFILPIFYILFAFFTFEGGNLSEEYSNFFVWISIYVFIYYFKYKYSKLSTQGAFIIGLCFAIITFIRINNAAILVSIIIGMFIYYIRDKKYKELFSAIKLFLIGFIVVTLPIFLYFIMNSSFYEFIDATFLFNFKYKGIGIVQGVLKLFTYSKIHMLIMLGSLFLVTVVSLKLYRKNKDGAYLILISYIVSLVAVGAGGKGYLHYVTILLPLITILIILFLHLYSYKFISRVSKISVVILVSVLCLYKLNTIQAIKETEEIYQIHSSQLAELIDEKNSVLGYNMSSKWLYANDITPYHRYYTLQDWWNKADNNVSKSIEDTLVINPPKFIVTPNIENIEVEQIYSIIKSKYTLIFENSVGQLYQINTGGKNE